MHLDVYFRVTEKAPGPSVMVLSVTTFSNLHSPGPNVNRSKKIKTLN